MKLLATGEIIWDIFSPTDKTIGGAPFNFCGHFALLGGEAFLFSAVGRDQNGDQALLAARALSIRTDYIFRSDRATGACLVSLDPAGSPHYEVLTGVAYDFLSLSDDLLARIRDEAFDVLYFGTLIQRGASGDAVRRLASGGFFREIFCDLNVRPGCTDRDSLALCLSTATILKLSDEDAPAVFEYGLAERSDAPVWESVAGAYPNIRIVLFTMGSRGSVAYLPRENRLVSSGAPRPCHVVSTVGAGDSYGAAFLSAYLAGHSIESCVALAAERSAYVVEHLAAVPL